MIFANQFLLLSPSLQCSFVIAFVKLLIVLKLE